VHDVVEPMTPTFMAYDGAVQRMEAASGRVLRRNVFSRGS